MTDVRLTNDQWTKIRDFLRQDPNTYIGKDEQASRRFVEAVKWMSRSGAQWRLLPAEYGNWNSVYNRFVRWAERGIWENLFRKLAQNGRCTDTQMIDSTHVKAHRSASGGKGGSRNRLLVAREAGATRRSMHLQMLKDASSLSS